MRCKSAPRPFSRTRVEDLAATSTSCLSCLVTLARIDRSPRRGCAPAAGGQRRVVCYIIENVEAWRSTTTRATPASVVPAMNLLHSVLLNNEAKRGPHTCIPIEGRKTGRNKANLGCHAVLSTHCDKVRKQDQRQPRAWVVKHIPQAVHDFILNHEPHLQGPLLLIRTLTRLTTHATLPRPSRGLKPYPPSSTTFTSRGEQRYYHTLAGT